MITLTSGRRYLLTSTGTVPPPPAWTGPATTISDALTPGAQTTCTEPFRVERKWLLEANNILTFTFSGTVTQAAELSQVTFSLITTVPGDLQENDSQPFPDLISPQNVYPNGQLPYEFRAWWRIAVNRIHAASDVTCAVNAGLTITMMEPTGLVQVTGTGSAEQPWTIAPMPSGERPVTALPDCAYLAGAVTITTVGPVIACAQAEAGYAP